jgi:serine/threonine-protein kinase
MRIGTSQELIDRLRGLNLLSSEGMAQAERLISLYGNKFDEFQSALTDQQLLTEWQLAQVLTGSTELLTLGPYLLLQPIAAGGMGVIYKARHRRLKRLVALKLLKRSPTEPEAALQRFLREAEAAALLSHPNIVTVHDAGQENERHYLAMEYVEGMDLGRLVQQAGPLPIALVCDIGRQIALGLQHAHERGFVHRDIKPTNVLIAPRADADTAELSRFAGGPVKILDMGLVRQINDFTGDARLTEQGALLGTLDYLAPEQALDPSKVDARADLYSLGCTLYYLLLARPPFPGGLPLDKILRHRDELPPSLADLREGVPPLLTQVVHRLLAKKTEERPATAQEVADQLATMAKEAPLARLEGRASPGPISSGEITQLTPSGLPPTRIIDSTQQMPFAPRRWWMAGAALVFLLCGYLIFSRLGGGAPAAPPGDALAQYLPDNVSGLLEYDLQKLATLDRLLPGLSGRVQKWLIPRVGLAPVSRSRTLVSSQTTLTISPQGEAETQLPRTAKGDLYQIEVGQRTLYLLETPPYRISSLEAEAVRKARDFAWGVARERVAVPAWPGWLRPEPEPEFPLWIALDLEHFPLPAWADDPMSKRMEQASTQTKYLRMWIQTKANEAPTGAGDTLEVDFVLQLTPREPEQLVALLQCVEQIQSEALIFDDAEPVQRDAWSPLSKLMRHSKIEAIDGQIHLHARIKTN